MICQWNTTSSSSWQHPSSGTTQLRFHSLKDELNLDDKPTFMAKLCLKPGQMYNIHGADRWIDSYHEFICSYCAVDIKFKKCLEENVLAVLCTII